ncbi:MAG: DNA/RNA nuclease SfsA [Clostridia bacterium]|jgi:sugar fermentation stimulation protein A|nr:DNA/RNA nuclease SfsA [Clostridia bacterium]MCI2015596.1 DNA/RNA nuclease SfsA [Clostridia bacterium]
MVYGIIKKAVFIDRPNRFIAHVLLDGKEETVHVKNTGRCRELLINGTTVLLEKSENPKRKTKYSLVAVYKGDMLINMDSQIPNDVAEEGIMKGIVTKIGMPDLVKREVPFSKSRFDIYFEKDDIKGFIEVKGVTLEKNGTAMFPDAPTLRGLKHVNELIKAKEEGYYAALLFVIQFEDASVFRPNEDTDPEFAEALRNAKKAGVNIIAYKCKVKENEIILDKEVEVCLY